MAAKIDRLKIVNKRKRITVDENGNTTFETPVPMYLDSTGTASFVFVLPKYAGDALELKDSRVSAPTAAAAEKLYEETVKRYSKWKRETVADLVVLVAMSYSGKSDGTRHYGYRQPKTEIGLGYSLAFRVPHPGGAKIYQRVRKRHMVDEPFGPTGQIYAFERDIEPPEWTLGESFHPHDCKILSHSDALVAKLDLVMKAISQAADVLAEIDSDDEKEFVAGFLGLGSKTPLLTVA